jgi:hypothetical protein
MEEEANGGGEPQENKSIIDAFCWPESGYGSCPYFVINVMNIFTVTSVDSIPEWWYPTDTGGSFGVFAVVTVSSTISTICSALQTIVMPLIFQTERR